MRLRCLESFVLLDQFANSGSEQESGEDAIKLAKDRKFLVVFLLVLFSHDDITELTFCTKCLTSCYQRRSGNKKGCSGEP